MPVVFAIACFTAAAVRPVHAQTCGETDYDCKIRLYQGLIKADAQNIEAYYNLGTAYQSKGDDVQAVAMYDIYITAGRSKPEYMADAYHNRGISQRRLGKNELAVSDYTKAIGLVPTDATTYQARGNAYSDLKNYDAAIADHTKAISLKPDLSSAYFGRGYAYMEKIDYEMAKADFTKALSINPGYAESYYNRGTIYYRQKDYPRAISDLDKYISLNLSESGLIADGYVNRGLALFYSGNTQKAIDDYTKAIELAPTMSNAYVNRALAYRKLNKIALALADEKKAAALDK